MRRHSGHMRGERYPGNVQRMEVHDLDNEKSGRHECQIDEIIKAGNDRPFTSPQGAHAAGYDDCYWCLGGFTR
jgi:hypothetical protein